MIAIFTKIPKGCIIKINRIKRLLIKKVKNMNNLYSASQARDKLGGISAEALKRLVETGKIRKETPPTNKKRGFYNKGDVDAVAEAMRDFIEIHTALPKGNHFEVVQAKGRDDIRETVQIAKQRLGENAYDVDKRMSWFKIVPNGDYVLKHNGIIVGYFSLQAIKPEAIEYLFHRRSGASIQLDDLEPIERGKPLEIHISGIGSKLGVSEKDAQKYGVELIKGLRDTLINFGKQGIEIKRIWARSSTVPGIRLCQILGFRELGYVNSEQLGFVLEVDPDKVTKPLTKEAIQKYCDALSKAQKH